VCCVVCVLIIHHRSIIIIFNVSIYIFLFVNYFITNIWMISETIGKSSISRAQADRSILIGMRLRKVNSKP